VVVQTYVVVITFGAILPFINILRSPIPYKCSNSNPIALMIARNAQID